MRIRLPSADFPSTTVKPWESLSKTQRCGFGFQANEKQNITQN